LEKNQLVQTKQPNKLLLKILSKLLANPVIQFFLDPVIPKLVTFYLHQYLNRWVKTGVIKNYVFEVQRVGRLFYKFRFHALAAKKETNTTILNYATSKVEEVLKQVIAK
jgi:hypothetical protein